MQITDDDVIRTLREVVAERPDYVYERPAHMHGGLPSCLYVHYTEAGEREPGCIVGQVLHRLGVPLETLERHEGHTAAYVATDAVGSMSDDIARILDTAQYRQDEGKTWGEALADALSGKVSVRC
jgi:hypothetical protein